MRIEAYSQVQQVYQTKKVSQAQKASGAARADQVQISSLGKDFQTAKAMKEDTGNVWPKIRVYAL